MNKNEYLNALRISLQSLPPEELEDILSDYEEHFNIGLSKGKSEEEISKELGNPKEISKNYKSTYRSNLNEDSYRMTDYPVENKSFKRVASLLLGIVLIISGIGIYSIRYRTDYSFTPTKSNSFSLVNTKSSTAAVKVDRSGIEIKDGNEIKDSDDRVVVGWKGIEVKDGDDHVVVGWNGIEVKDGNDHIKIGWNGVHINEGKKSSFTLGNIGSWFSSDSKDIKVETVDEEQFSKIDEIDTINISSSFIDIKVVSQDRDDIHVRYYGTLKANVIPTLEIQKESGKLDIKLLSPSGSYTVKQSDVILEVFVPTSFNGNFGISTSSADIDTENVVGNEFKISSSSGDIEVENTEGKVFKLSTSSGDIQAKNCIGKIYASTSSGDISLDNEKTSEDIKISTSSGNVDLKFYDGADYNIKGFTSSGEFIPSANMDIIENKKGKFRATIGQGKRSIDISSSSGDVRFNKVK